jgi:hypothetical protein
MTLEIPKQLCTNRADGGFSHRPKTEKEKAPPFRIYSAITVGRLALDFVGFLTRVGAVDSSVPPARGPSYFPNLGTKYYRVVENVSRRNRKATTK